MVTNKPMMIRMPADLVKAIDKQAAAEHRDRSGMVKHMIQVYLEQIRKGGK